MVKNTLNPHNNYRFKKLLLLGLSALIIIGGFIIYNYKYNKNENKSDIFSQNTSPILDGGTDGSGKTPKQHEETNSTDESSLDGVINYKSVDNDILTIRVTINQNVSSGMCSLKLTHATNKNEVTKLAEIVQNPTTSTCKGFDIPVSELSTGKWSINISVAGDKKSGNITGEIEI